MSSFSRTTQNKTPIKRQSTLLGITLLGIILAFSFVMNVRQKLQANLCLLSMRHTCALLDS
jgi:hypothetical protein